MRKKCEKREKSTKNDEKRIPKPAKVKNIQREMNTFMKSVGHFRDKTAKKPQNRKKRAKNEVVKMNQKRQKPKKCVKIWKMYKKRLSLPGEKPKPREGCGGKGGEGGRRGGNNRAMRIVKERRILTTEDTE